MPPDAPTSSLAWRRPVARAGLAALAVLLAGCTAMAPINPPLDAVRPQEGYRISTLLSRERGKELNTLVLLAFSGGGTRAAALSYGVLEELRRYKVIRERGEHTLLQEVDMISGVSGGSFTALAYAWMGERMFDQYEHRFLKRDVQGELIGRLLSPKYWPDLMSDRWGRSELAADYYDDILFDGATFNDLRALKTPAVLVSGTDISTGARFEFSQETFDLLCSDVGAVRLARAAATSSAVPVLLTPVTFRNYGGRCGSALPSWAAEVADPDNPVRPAGRAVLRYRDIKSLQDSENRPYLHVIDGGVSDNLGLRGILEAFEELEVSPTFRRETGFDRIRHILIIVVNSRSAPESAWDRSPTPPGMVDQLLQSSSVPIDHYSYESVELLKDTVFRWKTRRELAMVQLRLSGATEAEAREAVPEVTFNAIDISFDAIADPEERRYFMTLPTTFVLPPEDVDRLREIGGRLLRESAGFQVLIKRGIRRAEPPGVPP